VNFQTGTSRVDVNQRRTFCTPSKGGKDLWHFERLHKYHKLIKVTKSVWWMPWLSEAMKDVISCDKLWGGANNFRSIDFRMGEPNSISVTICANLSNWNI